MRLPRPPVTGSPRSPPKKHTNQSSKHGICMCVYQPHIKPSIYNSLHSINPNLSTINPEPIPLDRLERLLRWRRSAGRAEDQLGAQRPASWQVPGLAHALVDERVVVLQVAAEALGLEGGPGGDLVRAVGVAGPEWEAVGVKGEVGLHLLDGWDVVEEEDLLSAVLDLCIFQKRGAGRGGGLRCRRRLGTCSASARWRPTGPRRRSAS